MMLALYRRIYLSGHIFTWTPKKIEDRLQFQKCQTFICVREIYDETVGR